jgi:hypothetical protein
MTQNNSFSRSMPHPLVGCMAPALIVATFTVAFMIPSLLGSYEIEITYRLMLYVSLAEA